MINRPLDAFRFPSPSLPLRCSFFSDLLSPLYTIFLNKALQTPFFLHTPCFLVINSFQLHSPSLPLICRMRKPAFTPPCRIPPFEFLFRMDAFSFDSIFCPPHLFPFFFQLFFHSRDGPYLHSAPAHVPFPNSWNDLPVTPHSPNFKDD